MIQESWTLSHTTMPAVIGRMLREARQRALCDYFDAFPEAVNPWWVGDARLIRSRIVTCSPYTEADKPVLKDGMLVAAGTDSVWSEVVLPCPVRELPL